MLDAQQPMFTYASVAMDATDASDLVAEIRAAHRVEADELKGNKLAKSRRGRDLILDTLQSILGRYLVTAYDKKLSLACKFFEYIFEPVLAANNRVFYENDFHKFIATLVYVNFVCKEEETVRIVNQFERFMRTLEPGDAPLIFDGMAANTTVRDSLRDIASFIDGYRDIILRESNHIGNWVLDLSVSALWSHLAYWGGVFDILYVICDESKPLRHFARSLDVMVNRPERVVVRIFGKERPLTFNMARSVEFASSSNRPGVQLADIVSSALLQALKHPEEGWSQAFREEIRPHVHEDCILPDLSYMDLTTPNCAVNALILHELSQRASAGQDPLYRIEEWYEIGHSGVDQFLVANS